MAKSNPFRTLRNFGLRYSAHRAYQLIFRPRIRGHQLYVDCVKGKRGLEIGGPSGVFATRGLIPLYDHAESVDNCTFGAETLWARHDLSGGFRFSTSKPPGKQIVAEGTDLEEIADVSYDFILSSHMLEHTANPLNALRAWRRVLRCDGSLILLVPNKRWTFDHKRPVTTLDHLVEDFSAGVREDDLTHLQEVLRLHDLRRDPDAGGYNDFKKRSEQNLEYRGMHHHVFDLALVDAMLRNADFSVMLLRDAFKDHIIAIAKKNC
jgi:SAM-dependent methyltransferase